MMICPECGSPHAHAQTVPESDVVAVWCDDCGHEDDHVSTATIEPS